MRVEDVVHGDEGEPLDSSLRDDATASYSAG
jgi:hypothetical protein